jgi:hypothetical protein
MRQVSSSSSLGSISSSSVNSALHVDEDAIVSRNDDPTSSHGCYVAAWVWVDDPIADGTNQWDIKCPTCGVDDQLRVFQVTLARTGEVHQIDAKLEPDGFLVNVDEEKDQSTEDEKVRCSASTPPSSSTRSDSWASAR